MTTAQPPPPERPDKDADDASGDNRTPMQRFEDLARGIVNVPHEDVKREEERYVIENSARKNKASRRSGSA